MKQVKFVYFDLGGVAILDFSGTDKWSQLKMELGIGAEKEKQFEDWQTLLYDSSKPDDSSKRLMEVWNSL